MGSEHGHIAEAAVVRPVRQEELDDLVQDLWDVAAEGRWTGVEIPFDREARRERLGRLCLDESTALLVVDTSPGGGPGIVGHISIEVAPYGVADIGMLIIDGWRGMGLGTAMLEAAMDWATNAGAHKMAPGVHPWP